MMNFIYIFAIKNPDLYLEKNNFRILKLMKLLHKKTHFNNNKYFYKLIINYKNLFKIQTLLNNNHLSYLKNKI